MKTASKKRKGTRLEHWVAAQLEGIGIRARRQPGSGIYQDFPHDNHFELCEESWIVECKAWRHGWRTGDRAMGKADILVIKRDYYDPCVYMPWSAFKRLVQLARDNGA